MRGPPVHFCGSDRCLRCPLLTDAKLPQDEQFNWLIYHLFTQGRLERCQVAHGLDHVKDPLTISVCLAYSNSCSSSWRSARASTACLSAVGGNPTVPFDSLLSAPATLRQACCSGGRASWRPRWPPFSS